MKTRSIIFHLGSLLLIAIAVSCFALFVVLPSYILTSSSHTVAAPLHNARSVTISEFISYLDFPAGELVAGSVIARRELVLHSVNASPDQIDRFHAATSGFFTISLPHAPHACFEPHHRVEIVRADGSVFRFEVCFLCRNVLFGGPTIHTIPSAWLPRPQEFFTCEGMPPRTAEEYRKLTPGNT